MKGSNENAESAAGHHHGQLVTVNVDGNPVQIAEGVYKVVELKAIFGVAGDYELDEVGQDGEFKPLNDERSVPVRGGEIFVSHVRQGGSS